MRVSDVLRSKPNRIVSLPPSASAAEAAAMMHQQKIGAVLVCDEKGRLLGLLSERELALAIAVRMTDLFRHRIGELMTIATPSVAPEDAVQDVMRLMTERRARHLPVIQDGSLVGLVSIGDILKSRVEEKAQENAILRDLAQAHLIA